MSVIIFLIIIGILVAGGFLAGFIWAVKSGQYDDTYSPSVRMLFDDKKPVKKKSDKKKEDTQSDDTTTKKTDNNSLNNQ